jgi:hypothetical protein
MRFSAKAVLSRFAAVNLLVMSVFLEATSCLEMSVKIYPNTQRHIAKYSVFLSHRCENLKSNKKYSYSNSSVGKQCVRRYEYILSRQKRV